MSQNINQFGDGTEADNVGVTVGSSETIVLDLIPFIGYKTVSVVITNTGGASITAAKLYGSSDGNIYFDITALLSTAVALPVTAGSTSFGVGVAPFKYLRLTLTGATTADVHLIGVSGV